MSEINEFNMKLKTLGADLYLVGGCVRDEHMNIKSKDIDIEIFNITKENFEKFLNTNHYEYSIEPNSKFPVYRLTLDSDEVEIGFPRRDNKTGHKHTDFDVEIDPYMSIKEAQKRRDFTCNAIYFHLDSKKYIDNYDGIHDINNNQLVPVDEKTFKEDPLRLFRAFQFIARFGFEYDKLLKIIDEDFLNETLHLSKDSIYKEIEKAILHGSYFLAALSFLKDSGLLKTHFPDLDALSNCSQSPLHHYEGDVWVHTKLVTYSASKEIKTIAKIQDKITLFFAALLHDIGKPATTTNDEKGIRAIGHEKEGVKIAQKMIEGFVPNKYHKGILALIEHHMFDTNMSDKKILKLADELKTKGISWKQLITIKKCDDMGRISIDSTAESRCNDLIDFENRVVKLGVLHDPLSELISGKQLLQIGFKAGKIIGEIMNEVRAKQLSLQLKTTSEAIDFCQRRLKNINNLSLLLD